MGDLNLLLLDLSLIYVASLESKCILPEDAVGWQNFILRKHRVFLPDLIDLALIPITDSIEVNVTAIVTVHITDVLALVRDSAFEVLLRLLPDLANGDSGVELIRIVRVIDDAMHLAINGARDDAIEVVTRDIAADRLAIMEFEHFTAHIVHLE